MDERSAAWRDLYRQALIERDTSKIAVRIQEAEGAILLESASLLFTGDGRERIALQNAMDNLRSLRQTDSDRPDTTEPQS